MLYSTGRGKVSQELSDILLCEHMKWTYNEFLNQPSWFIKGIQKKINVDAYQQRREAKKHGRH